MHTLYIKIGKDRAWAEKQSRKHPKHRKRLCEVLRLENEVDTDLVQRLYARISADYVTFWREAQVDPLMFRKWIDGEPQEWTTPSTGIPNIQFARPVVGN